MCAICISCRLGNSIIVNRKNGVGDKNLMLIFLD